MRALVRMLKIDVLGIAAAVVVVSALSAFATTAEGEAIAPLINGLGNHTYPVSNCSGTAQAFFDQGLQLFYAFRYPESLASFREAARLDPDCAMTHWGAALAIAPAPNSRYLGRPDDPTGAGAIAVQRAGQLMAEAPAKEQALIQALARVYDQVATPERVGRDLLYVEAMHDINKRYPTDHKIATLYTAALMTKSAWDYWTPDGKPRPGTLDAVTALNGVLDQDLQHPGANHLFIHLLEDSQNPEGALPHAERLADMMPNVGHMVHMPTHIYIRTGLYQKAIDSNVQSIDAANSFITAWGDHDVPMGVPSLSSSDRTHASHAMDFIHMAAVLQGNAATSIDTAKKIAARSAPHLALAAGMQRRFAKPMLTYRRYAKWDSILALPDPGDSYLLAQGLWHFVRGSAFVNIGKVDQAELELATLAKIADLDEMQNVRSWVNSAASLLDICELVLSG